MDLSHKESIILFLFWDNLQMLVELLLGCAFVGGVVAATSGGGGSRNSDPEPILPSTPMQQFLGNSHSGMPAPSFCPRGVVPHASVMASSRLPRATSQSTPSELMEAINKLETVCSAYKKNQAEDPELAQALDTLIRTPGFDNSTQSVHHLDSVLECVDIFLGNGGISWSEDATNNLVIKEQTPGHKFVSRKAGALLKYYTGLIDRETLKTFFSAENALPYLEAYDAESEKVKLLKRMIVYALAKSNENGNFFLNQLQEFETENRAFVTYCLKGLMLRFFMDLLAEKNGVYS